MDGSLLTALKAEVEYELAISPGGQRSRSRWS
ncbi:hypothetical protein SAMN07250955_107183 [Arboricoccus pini]|uniref:Uncharacterized protein n=1 Tax=Arboricoccus pini TaxID=1963835 RepID=A0A212RE22_9PROT|nr:hypothetical protein SAMN07250955_107183 [Arboricoccus pini]